MRTQVNACGLTTAKYLEFIGTVQTNTNIGGQEIGAVAGTANVAENP